MDRSVVITLIQDLNAKDTLGVYKPLLSKDWVTAEAYAEVTSVTLNELLQASQLGYKPALRFRVFEYDFHGEKYLMYNGKVYAIYRVYRNKNELLELYTEEKVGAIRE